MKMQPFKRILAMLLAVSLASGFTAPAHAVNETSGSIGTASIQKVDDSEVSVSLLHRPEEQAPEVQPYGEHDKVRVSIVLKEKPALEAGYSTKNIAENPKIQSYRNNLVHKQDKLIDRIEARLHDHVDVVWNLTLLTNRISANVEYGQIKTIEQVPGVEKVVLEQTYKLLDSVKSAENKPNMVISSQMTGANLAWDSGYHGAGTRIAVIDTGLDVDHQSFDPLALQYAYEQEAKAKGMSYEDYVASLDLLDKEEIASKLNQLNLHKLMPEITAEDLYVNMKAPYGINYIDRNKDITHDNDSASEHGSHVSGIAAANRYLKQGDSYVSAADAVYTLGNAPDAQIIVMKVFGADSPTDADYMAALEDAVVLGCDVVNMSLGGSNPGGTVSRDYEDIMESLTRSNTVVSIANGNEGPWSAHSRGVVPNLYVEDVSMQTASEPATYTNSLAVASVDNNGMVTTSLVFNGRRMGYVDGQSDWCEPLSSLDKGGKGSEYDFVYLTGVGQPGDYAGIDVSGKIVLVSRGEINFTDKAENAVKNGAIATLVYNDQVDNTRMVLEGYWDSEPCAMISKADGDAIKAGSVPAVTEAGVTYYTGKITVDGKLSPVPNGNKFHTMSAFSSWGVPGDLSMKPEISAPGGNIYSVNGAVPDTDQYETMSGTSMAAPQVAGLSALLMERIHNDKLSQKGMTDRALAQSILMSTADPMFDEAGRYISILQQGAGLANVLDAVTAQSYLTVNGQDDGKVKAELGDDPQRTGAYTISFQLHNLEAEEQTYKLSADLFTQDVFRDYANMEAQKAGDESRMVDYMAYYTRPLAENENWKADGGKLIKTTSKLDGCDFDGSRVVDHRDGQALLDFVTGKRQTIENEEKADLNNDGRITSLDAHLFLAAYDEWAVTVPANGTASLTVTLTLTAEEKAYLDATYPNGAYIQGYVYAQEAADAEGAAGTEHNIPVLGFYGSWTDPSMFELGTIQDKLTGKEIRTTYTGEGETETAEGEATEPAPYNTLMVEYYNDPGYYYLLGGNPIDPSEKPDPQRTAINNQNGDKIQSYKFSPIRNAASSRVQMTDEQGKVLWQRFPGAYAGAYYGIMMFFPMWINSSYSYSINYVPKELAEGERFTTSVTLAPEYNTNMLEGKADWDSLGHGATLSSTVRIDNTAPELLDVQIGEGQRPAITVRARDNQYIAGVALFDRSGRTLLDSTGSVADAQPGDTDEFTLTTQKANGKKFLVQVFDYANNVSTYEISREIGDPVPLPTFMAQDLEYVEYSPAYWVGFDRNSDYKNLGSYAKSGVTFHAATMADPYIYAYADNGAMYVLHKEDLLNPIRVGVTGEKLSDLAYSAKDGKLYAVYQNGQDESVLCTVDKMTGAITDVGKLGIRTNTLAATAEGMFYSNELGTSKIYKYTQDALAQPTLVGEALGEGDKPFEAKGVQNMEYDPNTGNVVWLSFTSTPSSWGGTNDCAYLYEVKPDDSMIRHNDLRHHLSALVIPYVDADSQEVEPVETASALNITDETVFLMKSQNYQLTADVLPWNASDRFVFWESDDPSVVSVDGKGYLEAVGVGTAVITAKSRLNPELTDTVTVHVTDVKVTVNGLLMDIAGKTSTFSWNLEKANDWEVGSELDTDFISATAKDDYTFFATSGDGTTMKLIDLFGGSQVLSSWTRPMSDLAYSTVFSGEKDLVHMIYKSMWMPCKDLSAAPDGAAWDLMAPMQEVNPDFSEFMAIASGGAAQYTEADGVVHPSEVLYLVDDDGGIAKLYAYEADKSSPDYDPEYPYNAGLEYYPSDLLAEGYQVAYSKDHPMCSMVVGDDGNLYFAGFNGTSTDLYQLMFNPETKSFDATAFANLGEGVWPVALTKVTANTQEASVAAAAPAAEQMARRSTEKPVAVLATAAPEAAKDVELSIPLPESSTNGLVTVTYDPAKLTLKSAVGAAELTSRVEEEGKVTFGYANALAAPVSLTLTFTPAFGETTDVVVATAQRDEAVLEPAETETVTVRLPAPPEKPQVDFEDVNENDWFHDAVDYVASHNLFAGVGENHFAPELHMNRAMMATVLHNMDKQMESPKPVLGPVSFKDVAEDAWYAPYVLWAGSTGVVKGIGADRFGPDLDGTREQLAVMLWNYAGQPASEHKLTFTDTDRISDWAVEAVSWAVEKGIISGTGSNMMEPQGTATRAQAASMMMKYHQLITLQ